MPARKTTKKNTRKAVRRSSTKASRSAAAKKAARTRKANAAKRSRAAKKAAATRKRNAAKRSAAGKKAAASRKRKTSRKSTAKRGPSKAKRSAAAKKGWRTRRAKSTKRSNAAKRAARSRKAKTTRRKTVKRKSTAKKSGRMTKAKRSAAAKKGWRTRRASGSKRRVSKRRVKRKASRRSAKMGMVKHFKPVKGAMSGANALVDSFSMKTVDSLMDVTKGAAAGMGMLGLLAVAKGGLWDKIGVTDMVASVATGLPGDEDLVSAFDAMLNLATIGAIGVAMDKGFGTNKKLIAAATTGAGFLVAVDFLSSIKTFGIGEKAVGISQGDIPGVGLLSSLNPFAGAHNLGSLGMATSEKMFGMHNQAAMGMAHGNMGMGSNNLALAMSPNNTAATGNAKFFGTKSLGSTRVNLF